MKIKNNETIHRYASMRRRHGANNETSAETPEGSN